MENEMSTADSVLDQADEAFQSGNFLRALELYEQAIELARDEFNRSVEVEALAQTARIHLQRDRKPDGLRQLALAAARADDSDPRGWSRFLGVRGRFEWKDDRLEAARKTFDEMYVFCNTNELWSRAVDAANMITLVSEDPQEQIAWGKTSIEAAEKIGRESWLGPLWHNLACTYFDLDQFDLALDGYLKARHYHWHYSGEDSKLTADYHVGMTYYRLGKFGEAKRWLRPVLAWAERLEDHCMIGYSCEDLGEIEIAEGRRAEGLELLKRAREEYRHEGYDRTRVHVWKNINDRINEQGS